MNGQDAQQMLDTAPLDPAKLRVLADPVRSFVVYSVVAEAKTVKQLAAELDCPPTRLYYHLEQLQKHGLVFVERTRVVSGITEKSYRAAAKDWVLDRSDLAAVQGYDPARLDALLAFVFDQSRLEIQRQAETGALDLSRRAPARGALVAYRNVLKLSDAQADRLYSRLLAFWQEYDEIAKQPAEDGRFYAFSVALYPNALSSQAQTQPVPKRRKRS
jgi:predicted ArsR family transcriptional regulator